LKKAVWARYFALALMACLFWNFACVFGFSSTILNTKIFFAKISYFGIAFVAACWFFFALSSFQKYSINYAFTFLWIIPIITLVLVLTNDFHKLIWTNIYLSENPYGIIANFNHGKIKVESKPGER
jgi:hypothetical protein